MYVTEKKNQCPRLGELSERKSLLAFRWLWLWLLNRINFCFERRILMSENLGICEVCGIESAAYVMYPTTATDADRSNGPAVRSKRMCVDCAFAAFESGEWESDVNDL
jgi:hypothetical protein